MLGRSQCKHNVNIKRFQLKVKYKPLSGTERLKSSKLLENRNLTERIALKD